MTENQLRILRRPEVESISGLKKTRIDELEKRGDFPQRVRLSERATGWRSDEVDAWVRSRPLASDVRPDNGGDPRRRGVGARKQAALSADAE